MAPKSTPKDAAERTPEAVEQALKEQQEIFYSVIEYSPIGMVMVDAKGKMTLVNREIERLFGYSREELLGQAIEILIPESLRHRHAEHRENFSHAPSPRVMGAGRDLAGRRKDGSEFSVEIGLNPLQTSKGFFVLAAITDVSARKALEKRTLTAEHLAAVGKLSSHVAHEIRNPLSSISLNLDLLHDELRAMRGEENQVPFHEAETLLKAIQKEIARLGDLAGDYLRFSRLPKHQKEKADLHELFTGVVYLLEAEAKHKNIEIRFHKDTTVSLLLDPKQMQQVFINLIKNSIEAMPQGGKIEIQVKNGPEKIQISVRDEGVGMDEGVQKKLFDPFYTTKEKGTGLGLSLVRQIIAEHQGDIWCESRKGGGTTFFIELPHAEPLPHG